MRKLLLLFLLLPIFCFAGEQEASNFFNVKVLKVIDGDTFKIDIEKCFWKVFCHNMSVRVRGIDTPEIRSKNEQEKQKAQEAKQFTEDFLSLGSVHLIYCTRDKYFRLLCNVKVRPPEIKGFDYSQDKDLAQALLSSGLAKKYNGEKKDVPIQR